MIVTGDALRPWLEQRIGYVPEEAKFIGRLQDGDVVAVVGIGHWHVYDCEIFLASEGGISRPLVRAVFRYVFDDLGCWRCTARVEDGSGWDRELERLGFVREGVLREATPQRTDMAVLGMLRRECRWVE